MGRRQGGVAGALEDVIGAVERVGISPYEGI
jgi:hypothetical protein